MKANVVAEARNRRGEIIRELKVIDNFLTFYEGKGNPEELIAPELTFSQAIARNLLSVRLSNILLNDLEIGAGSSYTIGELYSDSGGFPLSSDFTRNFLRRPGAGKKALRELESILSRIDNSQNDEKIRSEV